MKRAIGALIAFVGAGALVAATQTASFSVEGWSCGSCAAATRIALKKLDGVEDVKTDVAKKTVVVTYDDAKTTPETIARTIEGLGYKARRETTAISLNAASSAPQDPTAGAPERVSFYEVPLECGAADGLGCGSASKPILKRLEDDPKVKEAKINYAGTVLAVAWKSPEPARSGAAAVEAAFKARDLDATLLRGRAREKALEDYASERWYGAADVDQLSRREAQVIATRLVNRARPGLHLPPDRLELLTKDLSNGIATILTRDKGEDCARDPFEELGKIASRHLDPEQMAVLRKAAEQGAGALPGEAR